MYGHQIRRAAQLDRTELWTDIKQGSLYGALHRMAADGAIEVVRSEQEGNMPARTVYQLTPAGRGELVAIRDRALRDTQLRPDPVDLALQNAADMTPDALQSVMEQRRTAIATALAAWRDLHQTAVPYLTPLEELAFRHTIMRVETELAWHNQILESISKILPDPTPTATTKPSKRATRRSTTARPRGQPSSS